jgi:hypothetical protein
MTNDAVVIFLVTGAVFGAAYHWFAVADLRHWMGEKAGEKVTKELPRVTFFRAIKPNVPRLRVILDTLVRSLLPGDQIVFGVDDNSREAAICDTLAEAWPEIDIVVVRCLPRAGRNPKISKLIQMTPFARHVRWIVSDSEALLDGNFLREFRCEWVDTSVDALTAAYRFTGIASWAQRLDAAPALLDLWPGLAIIRRRGRVNFTLGACTALQRADVAAVGGWEAFGDFLAEDHRLGAALVRAGRSVRLSSHVVTLESDPLTWRLWWQHQRRIAVTYRAANWPGFAGFVLTHAVTWGAVLVIASPGSTGAWLFFVTLWVARWLAARETARIIGFSIEYLAPVVLIVSFVDTICWLLAWVSRTVWWGANRHRVSWVGKFFMRRLDAPT